MEIEFNHRLEHSRIFGSVLRPVARIIFYSNNDSEVPQWVYVDSGADLTIIPKSLGDLLGFELTDNEIREVKGVGERGIPVILKKAKIKIGEREVEATIAWSLIEEVPLLLGRKDVFDNFEITFKDNKTIFRY